MLTPLTSWAVEDKSHQRLLSHLSQGGLVATSVLLGVAMWLYPGGTWMDPERVGHAFWGNFWCDLLRAEALSGAPNPIASELTRLAMIVAALTLGVHWILVARQSAVSASRRWGLGLGWASSVGITCVALLPSDRFPTGHPVAVLVMGPCFAGAVVLGALGFWRRDRQLRRAGQRHQAFGLGALLAALALAFGLVNLVQYAAQALLRAEPAHSLPLVQKVATLCLVAWVVLTSTQAASDSRGATPPASP